MGQQVSHSANGRVIEKHPLKESYSTTNLRGRASASVSVAPAERGTSTGPWHRFRHNSMSPKRGSVSGASRSSTSNPNRRPENDMEIPDNSGALGQSHFFLSPITSNDSEYHLDHELEDDHDVRIKHGHVYAADDATPFHACQSATTLHDGAEGATSSKAGNEVLSSTDSSCLSPQGLDTRSPPGIDGLSVPPHSLFSGGSSTSPNQPHSSSVLGLGSPTKQRSSFTVPTRESNLSKVMRSSSTSGLGGYASAQGFNPNASMSPPQRPRSFLRSRSFIGTDEDNFHHNLQTDTPYSTFKIHPSEHDLLNPIDTLLHSNQTEGSVASYSRAGSVASHSQTGSLPGTFSEGSSFVDDTVMAPVFSTPSAFVIPEDPVMTFSPLLSLPLEILYRIIEIVYYDDGEISSINDNLENFSKTVPLLSRKLHQLSLCFLYKYAIFNRPHSFDKFLTNLNHHRFIGKYVEFMDFQQFTSIGLGRTGRMNQEIEMVTSRTITTALSMTPNLVEFLASENIQDDMDVNVLDYLFNRLYKIQAIDFCGASSDRFTAAFLELIIDNDIPANPNLPESISPELSPVLSPITSISGDARTVNLATQAQATVADTDADVDLMPLSPPPLMPFSKTSSLSHLVKLSFHDCSSLTPDIFVKILPHLHQIRRLDLTHTSVSSVILNQYLPHTCRLTHLSLSRCSRLTTKDLINFLTQHPAVAHDTLQWLNLQIDSNVVSPLSDIYLIYTLKHLKGSHIEYLNLSGLPIKNSTMNIIKSRFPKIKSLSVGHSTLSLEEIIAFTQASPQLVYIDLSGMKLSRFNILSFLKQCFKQPLLAIEFDYKTLYEATSSGDFLKIVPQQTSFLEEAVTPQVWKFYDNEGRRAWIYKLDESDPAYSAIMNDSPGGGRHYTTANLTYYDMETGEKITQKVKSPKFLKYASRKINCSIGYLNLRQCKTKAYAENIDIEDIWPVEFSQRGIYNYYSLNVK
ncbi:hypothetical protein DICA0_D22034 [Diutina catenulata]